MGGRGVNIRRGQQRGEDLGVIPYIMYGGGGAWKIARRKGERGFGEEER